MVGAAPTLPLALQSRELQRFIHDPQLAQALEHVFGHSLGQVDGAVGVEDLNSADRTTIQTRFIGDGTHDVAWLDPVSPAHLDAKALHVIFRRTRRPLATPAVPPPLTPNPQIPAAITATVAARPVLAHLMEVFLTLEQQGFAG